MSAPRAPGAGFTLLPVVLAMSLTAAIAFLLNRDNGVNANLIGAGNDCLIRSSEDHIYEIHIAFTGSYTFSTCGSTNGPSRVRASGSRPSSPGMGR